jgi:hypothetical protein
MRLLLPLLLPAALVAQAPAASEEQAIKATVLDYVQGWYTGDAARMERALHPELAKRIVRVGPGGEPMLDHMGATRLVAGVRGGGGKSTPEAERHQDVVVLDVFGNAATAKATMNGWVDYLHLAKWKGRWVIVNVLWELKPSVKG